VIRWAASSTGVSSLSINNNNLQTPECLREAGAGGSNPLTPTNKNSNLSRFLSRKFNLYRTRTERLLYTWTLKGLRRFLAVQDYNGSLSLEDPAD
jgi:hypothetical protein